MKNGNVAASIAITVMAGAAAGCTPPPPAPRSNTEASAAAPAIEAQTQTVRILIEGMSCSACVARVKSGVSQLDGVSSVDVDLATRSARVRFMPAKVSAETIVSTINGMGYRAGPAGDAH
jgi:copper ion binding protein